MCSYVHLCQSIIQAKLMLIRFIFLASSKREAYNKNTYITKIEKLNEIGIRKD